MATKSTVETLSTEDALIKEAHKRFDDAQEHWNSIYKDTKTVLDFINGDQWDPQLKRNRESLGLPCLQSNQIPTFLRQITNEARQNCPTIQIDPKEEGADQDLAEMVSDLIRGIEQSSGATTVYDNASWYAAATGIGFFRIVSEWEAEDSMDQRLVLKPIADIQTVLMDPGHKSITGEDQEFCFILTSMSKDEYKRQFKDTRLEAQNFKSWSNKKSKNKWVTENEVLIAEYYYKEYIPKTLYQIHNNITDTTYTSVEDPAEELILNGTLEIWNQRPTEEVKVKWAKLNDVEILEETEWPGKTIPVIAVKGDEIWIEDERKIKGAVWDAMDSQRAYNYNYSVMAETISMAPKSPWVITAKQIENHEHLWRDANNSTLAYLTYNDIPGSPPPARQNVEPPVQAAIAAMHEAADSMRACFGMSSINQNQQPSGEAFRTVLARQQSEHTTTYHFYDNLTKSVELAGKILIEVLPTYYGEPRTVQLIKQNGDSRAKRINTTPENSLSNASFGVVVETGPSYATRRQDSVVHMLEFAQANPNLPLGDIIADESDWPGAKRIANRIRLTLPPNIQQAEAASGQGDSKQALQGALQQVNTLQQQLQQAQQTMQEVQAHMKSQDDLLKQQHMELLITKAEGKLALEKHDKENEIKKSQMTLDELETELSYKVKLKELALQERQLKIEEAKLAIDTVETMHDMNSDMHNHAMAHEDHVAEHEQRTENLMDTSADTGEPTGLKEYVRNDA